MSDNALVTTDTPAYTAEMATEDYNKINYEPVFPTLTLSVKLKVPTDKMASELIALAGDVQNYEGGYTTFFNGQSIDHISGVKELKEAIYGVACAFGRELKYECNYEKCSIQLWANVMRKGNYHAPHHHARSIFSGTFYAQTDDQMSPFVMINPTRDNRMHEPVIRNEDVGPFTSETLMIKPKVGTMNMWPSWLYHYVPSMAVDGPRVSLSFNVDFLPPGT